MTPWQLNRSVRWKRINLAPGDRGKKKPKVVDMQTHRAGLVAVLFCSAHGALCLQHVHGRCTGLVTPSRYAAATMMGRAEKRAAAKRAKKSGGASSPAAGSRTATKDVVPQSTIEARLREVPIFALLQPGQGLVRQGDEVLYFLDAREAERQCDANPGLGLRVQGQPLDSVFFDGGTRLKPSDDALREASMIPPERCIVRDVSCPLFCIDGFQVSDKESGANSLPLFLSRADLLEFAKPVYGEKEAAEKVLLTDLAVVVDNMLRGPAGLLRDARFFACAKALREMDALELKKQQDLFATAPSALDSLGDATAPSVFPGMKLPWQ